MRIVWTGDRYVDQVLNRWANWYGKKHNCLDTIEMLDDKIIDELYLELGLDEFVEYVFQEFPSLRDAPYCDYDEEWTWSSFVSDTKHGYDIETAIWSRLEEILQIVDNDVIYEYIDNDVIAEDCSGFDDDIFDTFFKENKIGKKMFAKDKKAMVLAFREGVVVKFENGYAWCPSEFVDVVMSYGDKEGHSVKDIHDYVRDYDKHLKNGKFVRDIELTNSRLSDMFGGADIYTVYEIDLESIAMHADLKSNKRNNSDGEYVPF